MPKQVPVRPEPTVPSADADRRRRLVELRDRLAGAIAEAGHRDLAPLASRYQSVLAELAAMPAESKGDAVDDLAARRSRRRSSPPTAERPAEG